MANWYVGSVQYAAVTPWAALTAYSVGDIRRGLATPTVGLERVWRCTTAGTSLAAEPAWNRTSGSTTTEVAGPVWTEITGNETYQASGAWAAPFASLISPGAAAWASLTAGDSVYFANNHAESAAVDLSTSFGSATPNTPNHIVCVNPSGSVPPVSADITTGGSMTTASGNKSITIGGTAVYFDVTGLSMISNGSLNLGAGNANNKALFKNCTTRLTGSGFHLAIGGALGINVALDNVTYQPFDTSSVIRINGTVEWTNTSSALVGATIPTTLFSPSNGTEVRVRMRGVDWSALGSGKTLINPNGDSVSWEVSNCKLGSSVTVSSVPGKGRGGQVVTLSRCDSGSLGYRNEKYTYEGTQTSESTIIRTGGATDGVAASGVKIVTTPDAKPRFPFPAVPIFLWNDTTGSAITLTLYGIWGGGAVPNNNDIWIEVEYLGNASYPISSFVSSGLADPLATAAALTTDTSTWGGSTTKFKTSVTFTPQMKGPITVRVYAGKASSTFYIDPKPEISGVTVSKSFILAPGVYDNQRAQPAQLINSGALIQ